MAIVTRGRLSRCMPRPFHFGNRLEMIPSGTERHRPGKPVGTCYAVTGGVSMSWI